MLHCCAPTRIGPSPFPPNYWCHSHHHHEHLPAVLPRKLASAQSLVGRLGLGEHPTRRKGGFNFLLAFAADWFHNHRHTPHGHIMPQTHTTKTAVGSTGPLAAPAGPPAYGTSISGQNELECANRATWCRHCSTRPKPPTQPASKPLTARQELSNALSLAFLR